MIFFYKRVYISPVDVLEEHINISLAPGCKIKKIRVLIHIHHKKRNGIPRTALVMGVAQNVIQPAIIQVKRKDRPASSRHTKRLEVFKPFLMRTEVFFYPFFYGSTRKRTTHLHSIEVPFMKLDAVQCECFFALHFAKIRICCVSLGTVNRLQLLLYFVPFLHIARIQDVMIDRKSTRLNSSHSSISYAVFCF